MKIKPLAAVVAVASYAVLPTMAHAQTLEEVVVTAQKREESLQKTPVAVQALNAEGLEKAGIASMEDLEQMSPSLTINSGSGNMQPVIRGIGSFVAGGGNYSSVATYIDGAYIPRNTSTNAALGDFDEVESVQVLKGPQGTLYGRNATGGAIVVTTPTPHSGDELALRLKTTQGNYGVEKYLVSVSGGLTDILAGSLSYSSTENDGFTENLGGVHSDDVDAEDREVWKAKLTLQPSDELEMVLSGLYSESADRFHATQQVGQYDTSLVPGIEASLGMPVGSSGLNNAQALFFQTALPLAVALNGGNPLNTADPLYAALAPSLIGAASQLTFSNTYGATYDNEIGSYANGSGLLDGEMPFTGTGSYVEDTLVNFKLTYAFDGFDLVSTTAYNDSISNIQADVLKANPASLDYAALGLGGINIGFSLQTAGHSIAQDIYLVSTDSAFDWIAGVSYFNEKGSNQLAFDGFGFAFMNGDSEWEVETKAVFGEVGIPFGDNWKTILGARYTQEDLSLDDDITEDGRPYRFGLTNAGEIEQDDSQVTYTAKLIYEADDWMVYGGVTSGFKGGNLNPNNPTSGGVDPEEVTNYEVGFKSEWMDNSVRLNGNVFYYDYDNLQLDVIEPNSGSSYLIDGTTAEISGIELEMLAVVTDNLTVNLSTALLNHEYTSDAVITPAGLPASTIALEGNDMAMTSDTVVAAGLDYLIPWVSTGELTFSTTARYNSGYWIDQGNFIGSQGSGDDGSFTVVNMNLRYLSPEGDWSVSLWGNNVFDEEYYAGGFVMNNGLGQNVVAARPATFGITGEITF